MSMQYPLADMLTRIRNATRAKKHSVVVSFSVADVARMCCGRVSALWLACVRQHEHLVSVAVYVIAGFAFFDRGLAGR